MVLQRWEPFSELRRMDERMCRLWRNFFGGLTTDHEGVEAWAVPLDVIEEGDSVVVQASLPGVHPDDIQVSIEENLLTIRGQTRAEGERREGGYLMRERRAGSFYRSLRLPDSVDADRAESYYDQGVLTIAFPKAEAKKAKHLKVKVGGSTKEAEGRRADK